MIINSYLKNQTYQYAIPRYIPKMKYQIKER